MRLKNAEKTRLAKPTGDVVSTLVQRVLIIWTGGDKFKKGMARRCRRSLDLEPAGLESEHPHPRSAAR
ncbi:conserved hypothetical protein [Paraburkholderia ribeironis]|uniref:Uncharacterized protein n=1 Tax=Paraburkholderia ribeironis TaxID=1247936 RepID=A0A1N7RNB4_9BURK|nr:conserved hypothetical protein [Paraburkholderia ribeironis]